MGSDDNQIYIKSFHFMRSLLKITSKKFNSNILSFYFKLPDPASINLFKSQNKNGIVAFFNLISNPNIYELRDFIKNKKSMQFVSRDLYDNEKVNFIRFF
jgi:hypothetical protein